MSGAVSGGIPAMGRKRLVTIYLLTLAGLAMLFAFGFSTFYAHLFGAGGAPGAMVKYAYAVMLGGFVLLCAQAVVVFRWLLFPLLRATQESEDLKRQVRQLNTIDSLTKAFNRSKYDLVVAREVENVRRYGHVCSAIMFDIDAFKAVNEEHGYHTGDQVLAALAACIRRGIRKTDYLFRWRGGKFLILAPHVEVQRAAAFAEKVRRVVEREEFAGIRLTISLGVTQVDADDTAEGLVARLKRALTKAKKSGRNKLTILKTAA